MPQILETFTLEKAYTFDFGEVKFYKNFLITELNEGISFDIEGAIKISELVSIHFKEEPFAYISNRINSYSVVPISYLKIETIFPTIKAFAAVTYSELQKSVIEIENSFLNGMLADFNDLDEAIKWTQQKLVE
ncbi:STAS/SEC14 domain-containing protein [uncultured Lacinutrix sp.]|uniref:STAS/SEC14 domain-containing protein n=1 Tax=uncultured Lacinutrix sp. TaxID=574032 RepID=UPI00261E763A|nr:STAS/SEC14 domain-containing protein [uncultured Lacinutrix sp.]